MEDGEGLWRMGQTSPTTPRVGGLTGRGTLVSRKGRGY